MIVPPSPTAQMSLGPVPQTAFKLGHVPLVGMGFQMPPSKRMRRPFAPTATTLSEAVPHIPRTWSPNDAANAQAVPSYVNNSNPSTAAQTWSGASPHIAWIALPGVPVSIVQDAPLK